MAHRFSYFPPNGPMVNGRPLACCDCGQWSDTTDPAPCAVYKNYSRENGDIRLLIGLFFPFLVPSTNSHSTRSTTQVNYASQSKLEAQASSSSNLSNDSLLHDDSSSSGPSPTSQSLGASTISRRKTNNTQH